MARMMDDGTIACDKLLDARDAAKAKFPAQLQTASQATVNYPDAGRWRSEKLDWLLKNPDEAERLYGRLGRESVEKALRETSEKLSRQLLRKALSVAPFVGVVAGMFAFPGKVRAKGLNAAIVDEALEQTPVVEYLKAGFEIGTGRNTIPDLNDWVGGNPFDQTFEEFGRHREEMENYGRVPRF
jgi:hypothetical protein